MSEDTASPGASRETATHSLARERGDMRKKADVALIARAREGDGEAFESLVFLHQDQVYGLCFRMLGNREDAEEIAGSAFLNAFRALGSFRGDAAFSTWLYRIAMNLSKNKLRSHARRPRAFSLDGVSADPGEAQADVPDARPRPDEVAEAKDLSTRVESALQELSPTEREILLLRDSQGLSYGEIGRALELNEGTVKSRLSRAREALAGKLAPLLAPDVERKGARGV